MRSRFRDRRLGAADAETRQGALLQFERVGLLRHQRDDLLTELNDSMIVLGVERALRAIEQIGHLLRERFGSDQPRSAALRF